MTTPLVTVGIPFYNCQKYLLDSIRSIFSQTYDNWELILLDDGSTDRSLQIASSINDPRVRVISDGYNRKLAARLNQITDLAKGKYIARMDSDDLCSPSRIQKQVDLLESDDNIDVAGCGIIYLNADDEPLGCSIALREHREICKQPYRKFCICHASIVARKSWCEKYRYNEKIQVGQDFNLWLRSYRESKFANVPDLMYYYRLESSFSLRKQIKDRYISSKFIFHHFEKYEHINNALFYALMQYVRLGAEIGFCMLGLRKKLLARRYNKLSDTELELFMSEIRKIKNTELPTRMA